MRAGPCVAIFAVFHEIWIVAYQDLTLQSVERNNIQMKVIFHHKAVA